MIKEENDSPDTRHCHVSSQLKNEGNQQNGIPPAAFYPIYFRPLMRLEEYQKEQAVNRAGIVQEDVQPPGLKVWSDPFGRK